MSLLVVGLNHTTAAIALREKVVFAPEQVPEALRSVCLIPGIDEAIILSTCNRTELIVACAEDPTLEERTVTWLAETHGLVQLELQSCLYQRRDAAAVQHLMQVASGLDSMIVGEPQIFGQLKSACATARHAGTVGTGLSRVLSQVFAVAKRVRTETAIGENPVSVAYAAVKLARQIFSDLSTTTALLVGAGDTIELVARHLSNAGVARMLIANRTLARAEQLASQFAAEAILLEHIPEHLASADIVISSTASQLPIIGKGTVESAIRLRKHKPMLMVDLAVPRDIEAQVAELSDVYLYSIDDLDQIIADNRRARDGEAERAASIIAAGVQTFMQELRSLDVVGTLREIRERAELHRDQEVQKALRQLRGGADAEQLMTQLARNLTNKFLHSPSVQLRRAGAEGRHDLVDWSRELFGAQEDPEQ